MREKFTEQAFAHALCLGRRSVDVECGLVKLRVTLGHDDIQDRPEMPYSHEQRQNFARGLWSFWGMILEVHVGGRCVDDHAASLWQIDCVDPCMRDVAHLADIANNLVAEADVGLLLRHYRADVIHAVDDWLEAQKEVADATG